MNLARILRILKLFYITKDAYMVFWPKCYGAKNLPSLHLDKLDARGLNKFFVEITFHIIK